MTVKIISLSETQKVSNLISYIKKFDKKVTSILPVKTEDRILTIKVEEIIKVEVEKTELTFYTTSAIVKTNGRLYQVLEKLNSDFVQVSKHGIINLNYLESLKPGFTGNMIAKLALKQKTDVSRRYLPELEKRLGL
ncbi:LytTR family DNA-binding domain-containing protein [Lactobacillus gasseri]|uniref:LytTR family DNA-binding domain-containing protein n=1 Tax=Lactobacillus sp. JCM 1131 TaxID=3153753 RepID=A0AAU7G5F0_9LACO|nr:LytTR family DNA-binding domain-containing protein [Lactobacillus gasseri]MDT9584051.1 LytTR family DNA-binding domain-containing protein [Lactobacillus gasseri]MDT9590192.1 LytTR family DNA-binding domain-containing protein [Lactobacillus gasseri]MDT9611431.1 LytTR family DNA-binding domain-containing protein [Lactobacillus gasseri]MDT9613322.1 LytTR family DNA-binding domain-containing protein [Lactobacillus gasseri]MDT9621502.1 LytTR family DNA-binding domain-containing protein [Lactobac